MKQSYRLINNAERKCEAYYTMSGHDHHEHKHGFIRTYLFSLDHKMIGKQYLFLGLFFLLLAGGMAMMIRWQLMYPFDTEHPFPILGKLFFGKEMTTMPPEFYNMLFTMHGSLMIFFAVTPIVIGAFGNFIIPLQIGAPDMAFPKLNMMSFWTIFLGGVIMIASFFVKAGAAQGGWTAYAPLNSNAVNLPDLGTSLWILAIYLGGSSSLMGSINFVTTVLNMRCEGMTLTRVPLTTWGLFFTAILNILWIPVISAGLFLMLIDRTFDTNFFLAGPPAHYEGGQPLLYQHLFWGFGHPEVYILIFPVWGIVGDLLSVFSRKPAFGYKATLISMASIVCVSEVIWGHHMFTSGMSPILGHVFVILTITVSVPTAIFFLNWLCTLWGGAIRFEPPMLFALGIVFVFSIGGLTGLYLALQVADMYLHDTYFVVGHFHYTLAASVFFGAFAGIYYWFPAMFGRRLNKKWGIAHFILSFIFINCVFFSMMQMGIMGHPRRYASAEKYQFLMSSGVMEWTKFAGWSAMALGMTQIIFVVNFFGSMFFGRKSETNPWHAASLEWTVEHPIPHGNFAQAPVVFRGPHEFSSPQTEDLDRDWLTQVEPDPAT